MHNAYAQSAYKNNNVSSLTPAEQVARLLEKAASHIERAKGHIAANDYEARYLATEDALKIIHGLQDCLSDAPEAAAMSQVYHDYYNSMTFLVLRINTRHCAKTCDEVMASLRVMASTWREVDKKLLAEKANLAGHPQAPSANGAIHTEC